MPRHLLTLIGGTGLAWGRGMSSGLAGDAEALTGRIAESPDDSRGLVLMTCCDGTLAPEDRLPIVAPRDPGDSPVTHNEGGERKGRHAGRFAA